MYYRVTAQFKTETAAELARKLCDGTIREQQPDGREIVAALDRAVVNEAGEVEFSCVCYCDTPLAHERATVYDKHFDNLTTEETSGYLDHQGRPFMEYLAELAGANGT